MTTRAWWLTVVCSVVLVAPARSEEQPAPPAPPKGHPRPSGKFFHSLEPAQQERFLKLLDEWSKLSPAERQEILSKFERYRNLTPEQRDRLRQGLDRFQQLPEDQRSKLRDNMQEWNKKWQQTPPAERERLRARQHEMRQKAEQDLARRLAALDLHPEPKEMRWIRQFYFEKRREIEQQTLRRQRELKSQLNTDATADERAKLREQVQMYRKELEEKAMTAFDEFARDPHPLPPPKDAGGARSRGNPEAPASSPRESL